MGIVDTSAGPVALPIRDWDLSVAIALFRTDLGPARELLGPMGVVPVSIAGRAVTALNLYARRTTGAASTSW
jgi:hypothetical protein